MHDRHRRGPVSSLEVCREDRREEVEDRGNAKFNWHLQRLEDLKAEHERQLECEYAEIDRLDSIVEFEKQKKRRWIERIFDDLFGWVENA